MKLKTEEMNKNILLVLLAIIIVILISLQQCSYQKRQLLENNLSALADTLHTERNELGQQKAHILELEATSSRQFMQLQSQDSTVQWLQQAVKKYSGKLSSATVTSNFTVDQGTTSTIVEIPTNTNDSIQIGSTKDAKPFYPIYRTSWSDRWSVGTIEARHDSISRSIQVKNEYEITHGYSGRWNPFKRRSLTVSILNLNPNTVTTELRSVSIKAPQQRFGFGFYAGYGGTLTINGQLHHGFQFGFGCVWRFWP